jgi:hypothetical protein
MSKTCPGEQEAEQNPRIKVPWFDLHPLSCHDIIPQGLRKKAVPVAVIYTSKSEATIAAHVSSLVPSYPLIRHQLVGYTWQHKLAELWDILQAKPDFYLGQKIRG